MFNYIIYALSFGYYWYDNIYELEEDEELKEEIKEEEKMIKINSKINKVEKKILDLSYAQVIRELKQYIKDNNIYIDE